MARLFAAILALLSFLAPGLAYACEVACAHPSFAAAPPQPPPPPPPCEADCFMLTRLTLRGAVDGALAFELRGHVRANEEQKVPLFGPPGQVRVDEVTLDGAPAVLGFDGDRYILFHGHGSFVVRGRLTLGTDQILAVPGPLVALDAHLTRGKLVEGEALSGISAAVLHFDPMTEASARVRKAPPVFRVSRALRFGAETSFVVRIVTSQETDLGEVRLPLGHGEKVTEVQGGTPGTAFRVEDDTLVVPVSGHEAELTVSGTMKAGPTLSVSPDARSAYEWWLVESDPEHRVTLAGDGKLVQPSESPIQPTTANARVILLQRGERLELSSQSLARGDVLAAAVRSAERFVAVTGTGEVISDETSTLDDVGLDHLDVTPAGRATYVSVDGMAQRLLHPAAGSTDVVMPLTPGVRRLRVQALGETRITPLLGVLSLPMASYPVTTGAVDLTVGVPEHVHPLAVLGGERLLHAFSTGDLLAPLLGALVAIAVFRTRRTRVLGAPVLAGLWFLSHEAFVVGAAALAATGGMFVAFRLLRGTRRVLACGAVALVSIVTARVGMTPATSAGDADDHVMALAAPKLPTPETLASSPSLASGAAPLPVSLAFPSSDRYVHTTRQLVTRERPFVPRVLYVTSALLTLLSAAWIALTLLLAFEHRHVVVALHRRLVERLMRPRAEPVSEALPPF